MYWFFYNFLVFRNSAEINIIVAQWFSAWGNSLVQQYLGTFLVVIMERKEEMALPSSE